MKQKFSILLFLLLLWFTGSQAVAQNAVAHVIKVGNLHVVKKNCVFQLHGIAHHAAFAYQSGAADEGAVAHFGALSLIHISEPTRPY